MEEEEQLDYDEEMESSHNKKELHKPIVITNEQSIQKTEEKIRNNFIGTSNSAKSPVRYYVNPNFHKNQRHEGILQQKLSLNSNLEANYVKSSTNKTYFSNSFPQQIIQGAFSEIPLQFQPQTSQQFINQQFPLSISNIAPSAPMSNNNIYINRSAITTAKNWDLMVDEFVRRNISAPQRHFARSRSRNYSSSSSSSKSRSRSTESENSINSLINKRKKGRGNRNNDETIRYSAETKKKTEKESRQAIECARAIGLDEDYLRKIEDQKKLREEIVRRKNQYRKDNSKQLANGQIQNITDNLTATKQTQIATEHKQMDTKYNDLIEKPPKSRLRPYLAIVITNLRRMDAVEKKMTKLASSVGSIKKIWRNGMDDCHVIFDKHEDAKQFILRYHGKKIDDISIDVTMKKVFLNIANSSINKKS